MNFPWAKKKCWFCKCSNGDLQTVRGYGIYGYERRYHFHRACLESTLANAGTDKVSSAAVDKAIYIADQKTADDIRREEEQWRIKLAVKALEKLDAKA